MVTVSIIMLVSGMPSTLTRNNTIFPVLSFVPVLNFFSFSFLHIELSLIILARQCSLSLLGAGECKS